MAEDEVINVLLVEDSPGDAALFQEYLTGTREPSFKVLHKESLASGLTRLRLGGVDVLLLDLSLPDSAGMDTILRARSATQEVPIVVLTGLDDEETAVEAVQQGAQDYLVKSRVNDATLIRSIRYAIQRHRIQQGVRQGRKEYDTRQLRALGAQADVTTHPLPIEIFNSRVLTDQQVGDLAASLGTVIDDVVGPGAPAMGAGISSNLQALAQELGRLNAGPRDLMEIYANCLQGKLIGADAEKRQAYQERALPVALEAMGHLASHYREAHVAR